MFAAIMSFIGVVSFWMITVGVVLFVSVQLAKVAITWFALQRYAVTGGAWFRNPPVVMYVTAWLSAILVGGAAFALVTRAPTAETKSPPATTSRSPSRTAGAAVPQTGEAPSTEQKTESPWPAVILLLVGPQLFALLWVYFVWIDTAKRIATLTEESPTVGGKAPGEFTVVEGGKNIVILCDGTGNRADTVDATGRPALTNVCKFYQALESNEESEWSQVTWYDAGVGTFSSRQAGVLQRLNAIIGKLANALPAEITSIAMRIQNLFELATGIGILENITQGYTEIVRQYEPGDRIAILGFSRGAYTARVIAGVIGRCGLLKAEHVRFAPDVVQLYRYRTNPGADVAIKRELRYSRYEVPIQFLGLWDTVASLGVPMWGWWFTFGGLWSNRSFDPNDGLGPTDKSLSTSPSAVCVDVRHALAIDERRSQFFPTLFTEPGDQPASTTTTQTTSRNFRQTLEQTWFRGAHADVGGGYAECALSDVGLEWMVGHAKNAGLKFHDKKLEAIIPRHLGDMHDEIERTPGWKYFGSWPRWHPCPRRDANVSAGFGSLHDSVYERAKHACERRKARAKALGLPEVEVPLSPDELHFLSLDDSARVRVRADRVWNRTGLVLENGCRYRIEAVPGGFWRDKECDATDAAGQRVSPNGRTASQSASRHGDVRNYLGWAKRLKQGSWMTLVGTLAHPREWPLDERRARFLFRYLLWEDPSELTETLIPLEAATSVVHVEVLAPSGVLHCFANDLWAFYDNNSGAIDLNITCVSADATRTPRPQGPVFVIDPKGKVTPAA